MLTDALNSIVRAFVFYLLRDFDFNFKFELRLLGRPSKRRYASDIYIIAEAIRIEQMTLIEEGYFFFRGKLYAL